MQFKELNVNTRAQRHTHTKIYYIHIYVTYVYIIYLCIQQRCLCTRRWLASLAGFIGCLYLGRVVGFGGLGSMGRLVPAAVHIQK